MYAMEGKYSQAQPIYARLVELEEKTFGQRSLGPANTLDGYAQALCKLGHGAKAGELEDRAKAIRAALPKTPTASTPRTLPPANPGSKDRIGGRRGSSLQANPLNSLSSTATLGLGCLCFSAASS